MKRSILSLILFFSLAASAQATISRVGTASLVNSPSTGVWAHVLSQVPTVGNLIILGVVTNNSSGMNNDSCTATDSASNALSSAATNTTNGGTGATALFIFYEIVPSTITTSISINCTGNGSEHIYPATSTGMEYSGVLSVSPVDQTATGAAGFQDPVVTWSTASVTLTAGDLAWGIVSEGSGQSGTTYTFGSGWGSLENYGTAAPSLGMADQVNVTAGSYVFNGTFNTTPGSGTRVNSVFASFKVGSVSTPSTVTINSGTVNSATLN